MPNNFATETEELGFSAFDAGLSIWDNPYDRFDWLKSEDAHTLYVRGHVDLASFRDACIAYEGCGISQFNEERHTWFRVVPTQDKSYSVMEAVPGSRGAFPATLMERPW